MARNSVLGRIQYTQGYRHVAFEFPYCSRELHISPPMTTSAEKIESLTLIDGFVARAFNSRKYDSPVNFMSW